MSDLESTGMESAGMEGRKIVGLVLGPTLFLILLLAPVPQNMPPRGWSVAAVAVLMATWWITEAIPIPATSLLPIVLFPALGVMPGSKVTGSYANHLIYLYLGGFLIAIALEKWQLHRRLALHTIQFVGVSPRRLVLGFMIATGVVSMWISNTATTLMMLPIGTAVIAQARKMTDSQLGDEHRLPPALGTALMLSIAYSASIGGVATLIGTPPNAIFAGVLDKTYGQSIGFLQWMLFALPVSVLMLALTWLYLTRIGFPLGNAELPGGKELIRSEIAKLGPLTWEEKWVLVVFGAVGSAWILRGFLHFEWLSMIEDSTIAIAGAVLLFIIPSNFRKGEFLLDWRSAAGLPWDIILLFGGGFALADGVSESGLTQWLAGSLNMFQGTSPYLLIGAAGFMVIFLTEVTSNAATASLCLPIVAAFAEAARIHPYGIMVTVAIGASYAFMLPVATPPNAIVFATRQITIPQMVRTGLFLNIVGGILLLLMVYFWLPVVWNIDLSQFPAAFSH